MDGDPQSGLGTASLACSTLSTLLAPPERSEMSVVAQSSTGSELSIPIAQYAASLNARVWRPPVSKLRTAQ